MKYYYYYYYTCEKRGVQKVVHGEPEKTVPLTGTTLKNTVIILAASRHASAWPNKLGTNPMMPVDGIYHRRYFQHAHFITTMGVGKRGDY